MIDFHLHLPWGSERPVEALLKEMDEAGVETAVVINIEVGFETLRRELSEERVRRASQEALELMFSPSLRYLSALAEPKRAIEEHERVLAGVSMRNEEFLAALSDKKRLVPVISYNPDLSDEENARRFRALSERAFGIKIFPTFHFTLPDRLSRLYGEIASAGGVVIVHTGCDPGIWELWEFCSSSRPSSVARAARRHRDVIFVVAHLGSYSAVRPGIFYEEAIEAIAEDNVYADISAVEPEIVERAVEDVGHEKLLFGSDYPAVRGLSIKDAVSAVRALRLPARAERAILRENAEKLLKRWAGWSSPS